MQIMDTFVAAVRNPTRACRKLRQYMTTLLLYPQRIKFKLKIADLIESELLLRANTATLLSKQIVGSVNTRLDIVVRYLVIEEYFGIRRFAYDLYEKMQYYRSEKVRDFQNSLENFHALIESVHKNGFDPSSQIIIDDRGRLLDGAHRLACALYFDQSEVSVRINPHRADVEYSFRWFERVGFTTSELAFLQNKERELFKNWGVYFTVILWPPVLEYFDEIEQELRKNHKVISSEDYNLNGKFPDTVKMIYKIDDIEAWKVAKKIEAMGEHSNTLRLLLIEIPDICFRKKTKNGRAISVQAEEIKAKYRGIYMDKVENYFFDIVMHIGDNLEHNRGILSILER